MVMVNLKQGGFDGLMEFLGAIKIMRSQNIFFDVPPDPLNQI
jgi:hypothetical protein